MCTARKDEVIPPYFTSTCISRDGIKHIIDFNDTSAKYDGGLSSIKIL